VSEIRVAEVTLAQNGVRLDRALGELFPSESRNSLAKLVTRGNVRVDGVVAAKPSQRVESGQRIVLELPDPVPSSLESQEIPLTVLYEDPDVVVIDKPAGLVVHPAAGHPDQTLVNALLFHVRDLSGIGGELRPGIVHRLDKDTSGVMLIAKHDDAHRRLTMIWNTEAVKKEYLAVVYGTPAHDRGTIDAPIGRDPRERKRMAVVPEGRRAVTDYEVVERLRYGSLVHCRLHTGRTHQIRVHMAASGWPLLGDPTYGIADARLTRQGLHSWRATFSHPVSGASVQITAPLPPDLAAVVRVPPPPS
jgi:23S rRNA pseudouridine1911/1915/1917 synthase